MAKLDRKQFFDTLSGLIGDRSDDDAVRALEDMTDTYNYMEEAQKGDGVDWKAKAKEIEDSWRKKYRNRFMRGDGGNGPSESSDNNDSASVTPDNIGFNDLFGKG